MHVSFATKALAISYLDRFMALMPQEVSKEYAKATEQLILKSEAVQLNACQHTQMMT